MDERAGGPSGRLRELRARVAGRCGRIVAADWFTGVSFALIIINALTLGAETYDRAVARVGEALLAVERTCLALLVVELALRFGAHLTAPRGFFRDAWNLFDLAIVCAPLLPGVRESITLLRLVRLARIVRAVRLFPSLRVVIGGVLRSLPGLAGFLLVAASTIYLYAMVGWMAFGDVYPEKYGTVGRAMLTLFLLLSLDGVTDALEAGRSVSEWSIAYYGSYIVLASYLLTNLLVGIVVKALEEAHQAERSEPGRRVPSTLPAGAAGTPAGPAPAAAPRPDPSGAPTKGPQAEPERCRDVTDVYARLRELRAALEALEAELGPPPSVNGTGPGRAADRRPPASGTGSGRAAGRRSSANRTGSGRAAGRRAKSARKAAKVRA